MMEKKIINASKQEDKLKDKFADELLTDDDLDNVAGGTGGTPFHHGNKNNGDKHPIHCH